MKTWIKQYFNEEWEDIDTDIDFTKHKPIKISNSLHIHEEQYKIDNNTYKLLYAIGSNTEPLVKILIK